MICISHSSYVQPACVVKYNNCYAIVFLLSPFSDVDDVHDLMDDIQEQNELATEISDALSTPFGINQDIDDVSVLEMLTCTVLRPVTYKPITMYFPFLANVLFTKFTEM